MPVYSVNIAAVVAVQAALDGSRSPATTTCAQVEESKALLYAACDRLGLKYWKSDANFVLVRAGDRTDALVKGACGARHLPARSLDRAGLRRLPPHRHRHRRAHARACIAVMEEVLCAAR